MNLHAGVATLLLVAACSCRSKESVVDAGVHRRTSSDVRSVLFQVMPEYRGLHVTRGEARLIRSYETAPTASEVQREGARAAWVEHDAGWLSPAGFDVRRESPDSFVISLPLSDEVVGRIFGAPRGPSSNELGVYLPRLPLAREVFEVELHTEAATVARQTFIMSQLIQLLTANQQWHVTSPVELSAAPDGGREAPERFTMSLVEPATQATMRIEREGGHAKLLYRLLTDERVQ